MVETMALKLKKVKGIWHARGTVNGMRVRLSLRTEVRAVAEEKRLQMELAASKGKVLVAREYFDEVVDAYLRSKKRGLSEGTMCDVRRLLDEFSDRKIKTITAAQVLDFVDRTMSHCTPSSVRKTLTVAKAIWNFGAERGWCDPLDVKKPRDEGRRFRWLNDAELEAFLLKTPEYLWPAYLFLAMTGARAGEIGDLEWKDFWVDIDKETGVATRFVTFRTKKGQEGIVRERHVPLNGRAMEALQEQARLNGQKSVPWEKRRGRVFRNWYGYKLTTSTLSKRTPEIAAMAGVEDVQLHDLRRTFASKLVQRGTPLAVVAELLGHEGLGMVQRYAHFASDSKRLAVARL
jgi:integrase